MKKFLISWSLGTMVFALIIFSNVFKTENVSASLSDLVPPTTGAFYSGVYRNLFKELGKMDAEIDSKVNGAFEQLFYGNDNSQRIYYLAGTDMAYILDTGSNDVRSQGMAYGMMICVQMNRQTEFNRLWKWAKTYMQNTSGTQQGYFAWQASTSGSIMDTNPSPGGEEYFITALLFASHRWGDGTGIFNYRVEAQTLLDRVLAPNGNGKTMFDKTQKQVVFVPNSDAASFTVPACHLPAFYELWALWDNDNNQFWQEVAATSREFFIKQANFTTGLGSDYAEFNGSPNNTGDHADFRSTAWQTIMNVSVDYSWFAKDEWQKTYVNRVHNFFYNQGIGKYANQFTLSGNPLSSDHSPGLVATNAVGALAATASQAADFVSELWNIAVPSGQYRYYDGCLYLMGLLHVSGKFKIYKPNDRATLTSSTPTPAVTATDNFSVSYTQTDWGGGATVAIIIKNNGSALVNGWKLVFSLPGDQTIFNIWDAHYTITGSLVTITNESYNTSIPAGGSVTFGFNIHYNGSYSKPTSFTVNDTIASVN